MIKGLADYIYEADAQDFKDCMLEHLMKHSKQHYVMISELYYNDKAHFDQLSDGCKASILLYLAWAMSREFAQEGIDKFMESL